jgi:hypothetical protein
LSGGLYVWECTTHIQRYITVLLMERLSVERYVPLIAVIIYLITGDYLSLLNHIQNVFGYFTMSH